MASKDVNVSEGDDKVTNGEKDLKDRNEEKIEDKDEGGTGRVVIGKESGDALKKADIDQVSNESVKKADLEKIEARMKEDEEEEEDMVHDAMPLDDVGRNKMFERGLKLDKEGKKSAALKCYLKCLVGLKKDSKFTLLPQCLRNIGDIYYSKDEYDKAISFIQAEKLYYESVLIDDTELQKHIDEVTATGDSTSEPDTNIDALRAAEFEQLARLCMDEKQPQLALEYAGKATKLRQKVYGEDHPLVKQSLDYFTTVYAEVGKVQYTESMSKYDTAGDIDLTGGANLDHSSTEPTSILRKRKNTEGEKEKKVRFVETEVPPEEREREEKFATAVLFVLFLLLVGLAIVLGVYIYCSLYPTGNCAYIKHYITSSVMRVRFWYYQYISKGNSKYT